MKHKRPYLLALSGYLLASSYSAFAGAAILLTAQPTIAAPPASVYAASVPILRFTKVEAAFTLPNQQGNPFDPKVNDVNVILHAPVGDQIIVPAFWDGDTWKVRFTPSVIGRYVIAGVTRNGAPVQPRGLTTSRFRCVPSASAGFVHRSASIVQAFAFSSGRPYYPLGIDVAWINKGNPSYAQYFAHMHQDGMNWARVWMNNWDGKNLEWAASKSDSPAIGTYSLSVARYWDSIFDEAEKDGVYIQMTLQHHGQYTAHTDPNWADNPFNVANGGFLKNPDDFFTDPRAKALTKAKYRYIVARYGYSTHLLSFELFNEVQNITEASSHFQDVVAWHTEMANYIRSIDPYHHLITTSFTPADSPLYKTPIDYAQLHIYTPDVVSSVKAVDVRDYSKPVFVGEWGQQGGAPQDHKALEQVLFTSIATPMAGSACFWFWDGMDQIDAWPIYASASGFLKAGRIPSLNQTKAIDADVSAPGPRENLSFTPPLGWAASTTLDATISSSGAVHGTQGMSSFLQGTGHTDMQPRPFSFHLSPAAPTQLAVTFGQVSQGGAHPVLALDGQDAYAQQSDFPKSDANHDASLTLTLSVPAGAHVVTLGNTGPDWITIGKITVAGYAPPLAVTAKESPAGTSATFYAAARGAAAVQGATITLPGLAPGRYKVLLWSPQAGHPVLLPAGRSATIAARSGSVAIPLPTVTGDIAGVVVKQ